VVLLLQVGCDYIQLAWEPPIIDGGCMITEHEISYSAMTPQIRIGKVVKVPA
jgi:hypothetical protein